MTCTVIISTFDHKDLLNFSIQSVLDQTIKDFELIVIGDGAPPETHVIMQRWCEQDSRISYLRHPKGPGHGELYRHEAILKSKGDFIFYLGDDDIWMPDHIEIILPFLKTFDFINTCHTSIAPDGIITFLEHQLGDPAIRSQLCNKKWNFFGPTCVAHTKDAYLNLSYGWRPRPDGIWSDLYMWRQWIEANKFTFFSIPLSTTLHFPSPLRVHMSLNERILELTEFKRKLKSENYADHIRSLYEHHSRTVAGIQANYIVGLLLTIKILQAESIKQQQIITNKERLMIYQSSEIGICKKEYRELKAAWSTRLGFFITYPFRIIWDALNIKQ